MKIEIQYTVACVDYPINGLELVLLNCAEALGSVRGSLGHWKSKSMGIDGDSHQRKGRAGYML
jgi:hypothetical protein